jgi:hypothetical protein
MEDARDGGVVEGFAQLAVGARDEGFAQLTVAETTEPWRRIRTTDGGWPEATGGVAEPADSHS